MTNELNELCNVVAAPFADRFDDGEVCATPDGIRVHGSFLIPHSVCKMLKENTFQKSVHFALFLR